MKTTSENNANETIFRRGRIVILVMATAHLLGGCISASEHQANVSGGGPQTLTAGTVQKSLFLSAQGVD
jgi:hypothetical protein